MLEARPRRQIELLEICSAQALFGCDQLSRKKLLPGGGGRAALGWGRLRGRTMKVVSKLQKQDVGVLPLLYVCSPTFTQGHGWSGKFKIISH